MGKANGDNAVDNRFKEFLYVERKHNTKSMFVTIVDQLVMKHETLQS